MVRFARFLIVVTTCGKRKSYGNHIGKRSGMLSVIITKSVLVMTWNGFLFRDGISLNLELLFLQKLLLSWNSWCVKWTLFTFTRKCWIQLIFVFHFIIDSFVIFRKPAKKQIWVPSKVMLMKIHVHRAPIC